LEKCFEKEAKSPIQVGATPLTAAAADVYATNAKKTSTVYFMWSSRWERTIGVRTHARCFWLWRMRSSHARMFCQKNRFGLTVEFFNLKLFFRMFPEKKSTENIWGESKPPDQ
jgi:hypothetical protein